MKEKILKSLFFAGLIPFLAGFLGDIHWILDGFSHFRVYFAFYFLVIGIASLISKLKWISIINITLSVIILGTLIRFYIPQGEQDSGEKIKILSMNLLSSNNNFQAVIELIENEKADIVLLQEINSKWDQSLIPLEAKYPFNLKRVREDNFGMVVLSKLKFKEIEILTLSEAGVPTFLLKTSLNDNVINFITTHPLPPVGSAYFRMRNEQFENINELVKSLEGEVILIGDLNTTSFSPNFNKITKETSLRDARLGFGLQSTWNARMKFISIAIDHVLVTEGIHVNEHRIGPDVGSDHFPVISEVALK